MEYADFMEAAVALAKTTGDFLMSFRDCGDLKIEEKGSAFDFVTNADKTAQGIILDGIRKLFPTHNFIGEEDGLSNEDIKAMLQARPDDYFWIVDPLDGTLNYIRGLGSYSVSIGLCKGAAPIAGVVYAPVENELYQACEGMGAFLNGRAIRASSRTRLSDALIIPAIPLSDMALREKMIAINSRLMQLTLNTRMLGSAAREIAIVAKGGADAYFEYGIHPWDVAAAIVISREAGAVVTALDGSAYEIGNPGILVTAKGIHKDVVELIGF